MKGQAEERRRRRDGGGAEEGYRRGGKGMEGRAESEWREGRDGKGKGRWREGASAHFPREGNRAMESMHGIGRRGG